MKQAQIVLPFLEKYNGAAHLLYVPEGVLDAQGVLHAYIVVSTVAEAHHGEVEYNTVVFPAKPDGEPAGGRRMEPFFEPARSGDVRQVLRQRLKIELVGTPVPERKTSWLGRAFGRQNGGADFEWDFEQVADMLRTLPPPAGWGFVPNLPKDWEYGVLEGLEANGAWHENDPQDAPPPADAWLSELQERGLIRPLRKNRSNPKHVDLIPGGLADEKRPRDFNRKQLVRGRKVEREHTRNRTLAQEIAMDHLTEDPSYYRELAKMERTLGRPNGGVLWIGDDDPSSDLTANVAGEQWDIMQLATSGTWRFYTTADVEGLRVGGNGVRVSASFPSREEARKAAVMCMKSLTGRRASGGRSNPARIGVPADRASLEAEYGKVWDTQELQEDFVVEFFANPYVVVTRKSDGATGDLLFQHQPRFYFNFWVDDTGRTNPRSRR